MARFLRRSIKGTFHFHIVDPDCRIGAVDSKLFFVLLRPILRYALYTSALAETKLLLLARINPQVKIYGLWLLNASKNLMGADGEPSIGGINIEEITILFTWTFGDDSRLNFITR